MDIQRPSNARAKKIRRIIYGSVAFLLIAGVSYGLSRLRPAAPTVDRATIWTDEVKRAKPAQEIAHDSQECDEFAEARARAFEEDFIRAC